MIDILDWAYPSAEQFNIVIKGARNPRNSWDKMDSYSEYSKECFDIDNSTGKAYPVKDFILGEKDRELCSNLCSKTSEHSKFLRMLPVIVTMNAPLYFWKEFDTYKVGTTANSCSTMHTVCDKRFELSDFSNEHLNDESIDILKSIIDRLNVLRDEYLYMTYAPDKKDIWWQIIQTLPSSYNQRRTVSLNYAVLNNIYEQRKHHKLDEWIIFCDWVKNVPYFKTFFPLSGGDEFEWRK